MPDYIVSLIPIPTGNRETAPTPDEAAMQAATRTFAAGMGEGVATIPVWVMRIVDEPQLFPVTVTAMMNRIPAIGRGPRSS